MPLYGNAPEARRERELKGECTINQNSNLSISMRENQINKEYTICQDH